MQSSLQLAELVRQKLKVATQLHQLGVRQGELVAAGDVTTLLKLLAAKQKLLVGLQTLERQLAPHQRMDPETRAWSSPEARATCAADAEACNRLLGEVMQMEQTHEQQMRGRRDQIAGQLRTAHTAHAASTAYQTHSAPTKTQTNIDLA